MTPERLAEVREYVKTGRLVTSLEHEMLAEIDRLRDLAQGRLEHFHHSEASRVYHFNRAEAAVAALRVELADAEDHIEGMCRSMPPDKIAYYVDGSPRVQRLRAAIKASELPAEPSVCES